MKKQDIRNIIREEVEKYLLVEQDQKQEKERPVVSWDTSEIVDGQVEFILNEIPEDREFIWEDDEEIMELIAEKGYDNFVQNLKDAGLYDRAEELAREDVYGDSDLFSSAWDDLKEYLTELIEERNPSGDWHIEGTNLGWRHQSGSKTLHAKTGEELLRGFLPDTDCIFYFYNIPNSKGFHVVNYHHDAPTGESYDIYPKYEIMKEKVSGLDTSDFNEFGELEVGEDVIVFYVGYNNLSLEELEEIGLERILEKVKESLSSGDSFSTEGSIEFEDAPSIQWQFSE